MKRLVPLFLALCLCISARAQVLILNDNILNRRMGEINAVVLDSLTNEPIPFASVYVIPSKDTTITNFILSDAEGKARLEDVPYGSYVFRVEMMGYKPFVKERYFRESRVDMGKILLREDKNYLDAAVVSDVGNPVLFKKDTVEFNASSFQVGANAMLKDLIKRMPGMEITDDGKVKFNGEVIDKLTVGGRTFFFDDQSTALNNLPASIVDKIRVIDRESEQTRSTGMQDGTREKVMDVALKKEYEKGWFGNAGVKGGTTASGKGKDNPLRDNRGFLYGANALVSAYNEKDQLTLIGNAQNIDDSNVILALVGGDDDPYTILSSQGLSSAAQIGANYNTSRIKDVETTVGANYKYSDTDTGSSSERTTYQDSGNLNASTQNSGKQFANSFNADMEFKKEKGDTKFHIRPSFNYIKNNSTTTSTSETARTGSFVNSSENLNKSLTDNKTAMIDGDVTLSGLGGKEKRTLYFDASGSYGDNSGERYENSILSTASGQEARLMNYESGDKSHSFGGSVKYTEPLGEKWALALTSSFDYSYSDQASDAYDISGYNDYYSSATKSRYIEQTDDLTAQYKFNEGTWLTFGGKLLGMRQYNFSKNRGVDYETGDKWIWNVTPTVRFQHKKGSSRFNTEIYGNNRKPGATKMLPVLNIADPARLSVGNVYLKPYTHASLYLSWNNVNPEKFSSIFAHFLGRLNTTPASDAIWYDSDGIMYTLPVNARKPSINATALISYSTPLDKKKEWTFSLNASTGINSATSYQARTALKSLDKDTFDYSAFMADFWGNAEGDRFYSGKSGFSESSTVSLSPVASFSFKYNQDRFWLSAGSSASGYISRYSLNPTADMNTFSMRFSASGDYRTKHDFEIETDLSYVFYRGYSAGYGQPEWQWNAEISKSIGAFVLSLKAHDILDQTRNLTHTVTANYEEDSYRIITGRYILFGVKWNFGKMNAANNQRAQQAAMNMVF